MSTRALRFAFALGLLALAASSCGVMVDLSRRLGFANDEKRRRPDRPSAFAPYLLEAFPEARDVRLDPDSPRLSLAAETQLTREEPHLRRGPPRFSPDGRLLAYEESGTAASAIREPDEGEVLRRLVIRRLDGIEIRSVPRARTGVSFIAPKSVMGIVAADWPPNPMSWAPSSDAFAYTRQTDIGAWEVMVADLAGTPARIAGPPAVDGTVSWSPSGDRIAYIPATRPEEIWVADPREKIARSFFRAKARIHSFSWSTDARQIAYSSGDPSDIFVLPISAADGRALEPTRLTRWAFDDRCPSFSPDGAHIAFYSTFLPAEEMTLRLTQHESWSLIVVKSDGTDADAGAILMDRVLASGVSVGSSMPPAWAPDGKWVTAVQPRTEDYQAIVLVEIGSATRHELAPDSLTNEDIAVSADGVLAYRSRREWGDHEVLGLVARGATRTER